MRWGRDATARSPEDQHALRLQQAKALAHVHLELQELLVEVEDLLEMQAAQDAPPPPASAGKAW